MSFAASIGLLPLGLFVLGCRKIQPIDKSIDEAHRIVRADIIVNRLRQENNWDLSWPEVRHAAFYPSIPLVGKCRSGPQSQNVMATPVASTRRLRRFMRAPSNRRAIAYRSAVSDPFTWFAASVRWLGRSRL